jgi:isopenicillin N synthase-like dioxygenase
MELAADLGGRILDAIARHAGVDATCFGQAARDGYLVAKLIGYHPQPSATAVRSGVAPHVDFSWLTINLQDSDGLEVRRPDGGWTKIDLRHGAVWIHAGELLEHATAGRYQATPHRVINHSPTRTRVSVPVFVNPPLDALVPVFPALPQTPRRDPDPAEHVHRVLPPRRDRRAFHFGEAEWHRKGLGGWCFSCRPSSRRPGPGAS